MTALVGKIRNPFCAACGERINDHDSHMSMGTFGLSHLKESCLTIMTARIRQTEGEWTWNAKERIKTEGQTDDDRVPIEAEGSGEI